MSSDPRDVAVGTERDDTGDHMMSSHDSQLGTGALALRVKGCFSLSPPFFLNSLEKLVLWSHDNKELTWIYRGHKTIQRGHVTVQRGHTWSHEVR